MDPAYLSPGQLLIDDGPKIKLQSDQLNNFKPGAVFNIYDSSLQISSSTMSDTPSIASNSQTGLKNNLYYLNGPITSVNFHGSGASLLATTLHSTLPNKTPRELHQLLYHTSHSSLDPSTTTSKIHLFNAARGIHTRTCTFEQQHIDIAKFSHHYSAVIHSGYKYEPTEDKSMINLAYTSLLEGAQLQQFKGHSDRIVSLSLNPLHDHFLSTSDDNSARLFDLRSEKTQGVIRTPSASIGCYDPQGLVFALALKQNCIKLFDSRVLERGPFSSIWLSNLPQMQFTSIRFSPDGSMLIVSCIPEIIIDDINAEINSSLNEVNHVLLIDAFNGQVLQRISTPRNLLPLDKTTLKGVYADPEMIAYAPSKIESEKPPAHFTTNLASSNTFTPTRSLPSIDSTNPTPLTNPSNSTDITSISQNIQFHNQILHPLHLESSKDTFINPNFPNLPPPNFKVPCSMTTDCKYLTIGTHTGTLPTHDIRTGRQVVTFSHKHQAELMHVEWNPTRTQLVTVDPYELCFWVPSAK